MATWRDLSESNRAAAARLHRDPQTARASVSRSYYAVYHEITHRLVEAGFRDFGSIEEKPRKNPAHDKLANHVSRNIAGLQDSNRKELRKAVTRLRERRNGADYRPGNTVDVRTAKEALRDMFYALEVLSRAKEV